MNRETVLAFDEADGKLLIAAADVAIGDRVCFRASFADYDVEGIDTNPLGLVRHHHSDGMASSSYHPGELLWVRTNRPRRLGYLGRRS